MVNLITFSLSEEILNYVKKIKNKDFKEASVTCLASNFVEIFS